jgi:ADP-ribosylglycohydrolase
MSTLSQIQGSLLGLAVADAVAAPWEGIDGPLLYELGPADAIVAHESRRRITYTDDTQMTIGVAEELVECGGIDVEALARRFATNYHPDRGYRQGARKIINAIGSGKIGDSSPPRSSPTEYLPAISRAIGQGNDVDTLAAMTGALVGARLGIDGVPRHLIDLILASTIVFKLGRRYFHAVARSAHVNCGRLL